MAEIHRTWNGRGAILACGALLCLVGCDKPGGSTGGTPQGSSPGNDAGGTATSAPSGPVRSMFPGNSRARSSEPGSDMVSLDRSAPSTPPRPEAGSATPSASPAGPFTPPSIDTSKLPSVVRARIEKALTDLKGESAPASAAATIGALLVVHGSAQDAVTFMARAAELEPTKAGWTYMLGLVQEKAGDRKAAIASFEKVAQIEPRYFPAFIRLGDIYKDPKFAGADKQKAAECYRSAAEAGPGDGISQYAAAVAMKELGRKDEALKFFERATTVAPLFQKAHQGAAEILRELSRTSDAEKHEKAAAAGDAPPSVVDPYQVQILQVGLELNALISTGLACAQQGLFDQANEALMVATSIEENGTRARRGLAFVRMLQGKPEEAISHYRMALDREPENPAVLAELGEALARTKQDADALKILQKAIAVSPKVSGPHFWIGTIQERAGDTAAAEAAWRKSIELAPQVPQGYSALAQLLTRQKRTGEAVQLLRDAIAKIPDSAVLLNSLAWILATSPDDKIRSGAEAVKAAERANELTKKEMPEMLDTLAAAYAEAGRWDEAVDTQQKAVKRLKETQNEAAVEDFRNRVKLYRAQKAYRDSK